MSGKTLDKKCIRDHIKSVISEIDINSLESKVELVKKFVSNLENSGYDRDWIHFVAEPAMISLIHSYETPALEWIVRSRTLVAWDNSGNRVKISSDYVKSNYYQSSIHDKEGHFLCGAAGPFIESLKAHAESNMDCELDKNSILRYYNDTRKSELELFERSNL